MENETLNTPKEMDKRTRREFSSRAKKEYIANFRTRLRDMNVQILKIHSSSRFEFRVSSFESV